MNPNKRLVRGTFQGFWKNVTLNDRLNRVPHIWLHIDTSEAEFRCTPKYFITLFGNDRYWMMNTSEAIFNASKNGFDVYLALPEGFLLEDITGGQAQSLAEFANKQQWGIYWFALEHACRAPVVFEGLQAAS